MCLGCQYFELFSPLHGWKSEYRILARIPLEHKKKAHSSIIDFMELLFTKRSTAIKEYDMLNVSDLFKERTQQLEDGFPRRKVNSNV
jgi:hypothetical protein